MTIKDICKVHYLSCVEAYFGAWIRDYIELPALYCESYLSWDEVVRAFTDDRVNYADFSLIPRLQELSERVGITTHCKGNVIPAVRGKDELMLLSVKENFFSRQKPWRSDHYISVERLTEKKISYLNEYPLEEGEISLAEFSDQFGGTCLIYRVTGNDGQAEILRQSELQLQKLRGNELSKMPNSLSVKQLRDAIGILRVSRKRTLEWLTWYEQNCYVIGGDELRERIAKQINYADKYYFLAQRLMIRGETDENFIQEAVQRLGEME